MLKKRPLIAIFIIFISIVGISGCAGKIKKNGLAKKDTRDWELPPNHSTARHEGSLWQERGSFSHLYMDHKAICIGDIVTINVVEVSSATRKATTKTSRKSSIKAGLDKFFNLEKKYPSTHPFLNPFSGVEGGMENDFDGSGTTTRSGNLSAIISARVVVVLSNGNLIIEGKREIIVNNEEQYMILRGVIRPEDISFNNVVLSTQIADAQIAYSGKGMISKKQKPGWLVHVFDRAWPF